MCTAFLRSRFILITKKLLISIPSFSLFLTIFTYFNFGSVKQHKGKINSISSYFSLIITGSSPFSLKLWNVRVLFAAGGGGGKVVEPMSPARTRNGENQGHADVKFSYRPSVPTHRRIKESPLSSDAIFRHSHASLFNLCVVVLVAVNSGLIIENLMKYGILIRSGFWFSSRSFRDWPLLMCCYIDPDFVVRY